MENSCIWYSQVLTKHIGIEKLKHYVGKFAYGNQDLAGDKGKNNDITNAWLSSSLEISPKEQIFFLKSLIEHKLPVTLQSHEMTKHILFLEELPGGWKLYAKIGSGQQLTSDRKQKLELKHGWLVRKRKMNNSFCSAYCRYRKARELCKTACKGLRKEKINTSSPRERG